MVHLPVRLPDIRLVERVNRPQAPQTIVVPTHAYIDGRLAPVVTTLPMLLLADYGVAPVGIEPHPGHPGVPLVGLLVPASRVALTDAAVILDGRPTLTPPLDDTDTPAVSYVLDDPASGEPLLLVRLYVRHLAVEFETTERRRELVTGEAR